MSDEKRPAKVWIRDEKDRFLVLHKPTGMYYVRAKKKGKKPLFKKTGYSQKSKAKTKALIQLAEWMGTRPPEGQVILFADFAESYLEHLELTKLRPRTKEQARIYIRALIAEIGHRDIAAINEGFFDEWLAEFRARVTRTTFGDYAKYLGKVLRHAHRKQIIARLPEFKNPDAPKKTGRAYTHEEIAALFAQANDTLELQLRLCLQSFMRLREMLFLTWDRVNLETGLIKLGAEDVKTGSKTGEGREFFVNARILELLKARRNKKSVRVSAYVFPSRGDRTKPVWSNKTAWRSAKAAAGIEGKARWHDLRHTALTWALVEEKQNPLFVSVYAGVSMRTIQRVYLKVKPEHTREIADCIRV
jgi:integrase